MRLHGLLVCSLVLMMGCKSDDRDEDGYGSGVDCDDRDADVFPGADEICNLEDDDCDGVIDNAPVNGDAYFTDLDGDGFGDEATAVLACEAPAGSMAVGGDCDDLDPEVNPDGSEVCNGADDDCDGAIDIGATDGSTFFADVDGDGFGDDAAPLVTCELPDGYAAEGGDCEDTVEAVNPSASEICGDGYDNNCDGSPNQCDWSGDMSAADADSVLVGGAGALMGAEVAWAGDLDGDGFSDALMGATGTSTSDVESFEGEVFIAYGGAAELGGAVGLRGIQPGEYVGYSSAGLGDVDGDGFDDVMIGAPGYSAFDGVGWLVYGGATRLEANGLVDVAIGYHGGYGEGAGTGVASAGDVNGDGMADVLIGGFLADGAVADAGAAWLIYGAPRPTDRVELTTAGLRVNGVAEASDIGDRNAMAGLDLDGDGASDVAFGVWSRDTIPYEADTWLFYGDAAAPLGGTVNVSDGDLQIDSKAYGSGYMSTLNAGDVNGDGLEDLALGIDNQQASDQANAYLFYGSTTRRTGTIRANEADVTVLGDITDYTLVPAAGDLNGDGKNDLILGSNYSEAALEEAGAVEIYFGGDLDGVYDGGSPDARILGTETGGWFGYSVAADGDIDGDGVGDLLVGAAYEGATLEGASYLFLGATW